MVTGIDDHSRFVVIASVACGSSTVRAVALVHGSAVTPTGEGLCQRPSPNSGLVTGFYACEKWLLIARVDPLWRQGDRALCMGGQQCRISRRPWRGEFPAGRECSAGGRLVRGGLGLGAQ